MAKIKDPKTGKESTSAVITIPEPKDDDIVYLHPMTIEKFIEDAIEGGWKKDWYFSHFTGNEVAFGDTRKEDENNPCYYKDIHEILLDPEAWQAVGKVRGWDESYFHANAYSTDYELFDMKTEVWQMNMHRMIDALAEGKTLEDFFATL